MDFSIYAALSRPLLFFSRTFSSRCHCKKSRSSWEITAKQRILLRLTVVSAFQHYINEHNRIGEVEITPNISPAMFTWNVNQEGKQHLVSEFLNGSMKKWSYAGSMKKLARVTHSSVLPSPLKFIECSFAFSALKGEESHVVATDETKVMDSAATLNLLSTQRYMILISLKISEDFVISAFLLCNMLHEP